MNIDLDSIRKFLGEQIDTEKDALAKAYLDSIKRFRSEEGNCELWKNIFVAIYLVHHRVPDDQILAMSLEERLTYAYLLI